MTILGNNTNTMIRTNVGDELGSLLRDWVKTLMDKFHGVVG